MFRKLIIFYTLLPILVATTVDSGLRLGREKLKGPDSGVPLMNCNPESKE